ncbi:hypothetical protein ACFX2I_030163 [Malus domestica]
MDLWWKNINEFIEASARVEDDDWNKDVGPLSAAGRPSLHWQRPRYETIKINTDAAWCKDSLRAGVGWVGRDFAGVLQAAGVWAPCYALVQQRPKQLRSAML